MYKKSKDLPEVTELEEHEVAAIIHALEESALEPSMKKIVIKCVELALWLPGLLQKKNISLSRLRRLLFGKGYKANKKKIDDNDKKQTGSNNDPGSAGADGDGSKTTSDTNEPSAVASTTSDPNNQQLAVKDTKKKPGHGRMPSNVYKDVEELIHSNLERFKAGDLCPEECGGRLAKYGSGTMIRIKGQNFARILHYVVEKLRCALCGHLLVAKLPADAGNEKYDNAFKSMIVLQKYYLAVPFYRQEYFQALLGFPLPDSTQWYLIEKTAQPCYYVFDVLKGLAANGKLFYNDDTSLKILEHIKDIKADLLKRVGMFTTCILGGYENHLISLFFNGIQHGGENADELLTLRSADKPPILQMCDGLVQQTEPKKAATIVCNCMSHGFRKFEELVDYYPTECSTIMGYIGEFYRIDKMTKEMSDEERLLQHQKNSQPIAEELINYMNHLLDKRLIEPNSELGGAIKYMKKRWQKITRFLTVAGAPLDNNITERALKVPIRNRKAAMFYRSKRSAYIGGMLTSLIYTSHLAKKNAHHYLTTLQDYHTYVRGAPKEWLPWNYQETLAALVAI